MLLIAIVVIADVARGWVGQLEADLRSALGSLSDEQQRHRVDVAAWETKLRVANDAVEVTRRCVWGVRVLYSSTLVSAKPHSLLHSVTRTSSTLSGTLGVCLSHLAPTHTRTNNTPSQYD
jgi:hypothetical protein